MKKIGQICSLTKVWSVEVFTSRFKRDCTLPG
jgi:hypothetical protein